jgi:6-pyruvoyl-tetrahydropterin synthase related domain
MTADMDAETQGSVLVDDRDAVEADVSDDDAWTDLPWPGEPEEPPPEDPVARAHRERFVQRTVDWVVVAACALFVFANLHPDEILSSAVPAGGDMGAHVWGPAFLRDHLLADGRLSGWTPDWYAGFPAYQFYMVVPSLLIVALDVGVFGGWTMLIPLALAGGVAWASTRVPGWQRWALVVLAVVIVVAGVELPYGTAFKLVTVLGVLSLPVCTYAFGRLADLPFPGPALLSVASVLFLFDRNFTIYGGNVASTLAGEFAFSISLSLSFLYLGVVMRGLRTGKHRALAAVLLALTGLCHLIPAFFALAGTVVIALLRRPARRTVVWLACVLPVGGLISAFWVLPFAWQRAYVNDMGWEKLPYSTAENGYRSLSDTLLTFQGETYWKYLIPRPDVDSPNDLRWILALAAMGLVLSIAFRVRTGIVLAGLALVMAVAFVVVPEGRLWNARLLPFYYLCLYLLAAVGVAEVGRTLAVLVARDPERPSIVTPAVTVTLALLITFVAVGMPLRSLPLGEERADGSYSWMGLTNGADQGSFVRSWARWNYTGYEGKDAYAEYRDLMLTMEEIGAENGCGRAFWEYEKEINRYGTPMALMLLPHWTDGCIGSMEGLFFESSATTPFHFLTQVELSASPSAAQRDLPYGTFDIDKGVRHLQLMGVRYYLATSAQATTAARDHPDLTELATSGPWVIFEVADSELVEALENEPAVLDGVSDAQHDWICRTKGADGKCAGPAVTWYQDLAAQDVMLASSGPEAWQRVDPDDPRPEARPVDGTEISGVVVETDRIAFDVEATGSPVLVKASYFPNWRVQGADGPYRVAPNLMVVVPTEEHVELSYGREPVEWIAYALTALGIALAILLAFLPPVRGRSQPTEGPADPVDGDVDAADGVAPTSPAHLAP